MASEDRSEDGSFPLDCGDAIDPATFEQILEMDDDEEDREFSRQIVLDFFEQVTSTFQNIEQALEGKDLQQLSQLGHFLKGSSATLGLIKVKESCEKIQHLGSGKDERGDNPLPAARCLERIAALVPVVKAECADAEKRLKRFYHVEES